MTLTSSIKFNNQCPLIRGTCLPKLVSSNLRLIHRFPLSTKNQLENVLPSLAELQNANVTTWDYHKNDNRNKVVHTRFKRFIDIAYSEVSFVDEKIISESSYIEFLSYQQRYLAILPEAVMLLVEEEEKRLLALSISSPKSATARSRDESYFQLSGPNSGPSSNLVIPPREQFTVETLLFRVQSINRFLTALIRHLLHLARFPRYSGLVSALSFQLYTLFNRPHNGSGFMFWSLTISTICTFHSEKMQLRDVLIMFEVQLLYCFFNENPSLRTAKKTIKARHDEALVSELIS